MTDIDIAELERLAEAASPGPWLIDEDDREGMEWNRHIVRADATNLRICFMTSNGSEANADFIVAARDSIPALLARLKAAETERALLKSAEGKNARVRRRIRRVEHFSPEKETTALAIKLEAAKSELKSAKAAEKSRIVAALLAEAEHLPCVHDRDITRSNARLIEADFEQIEVAS